MLHQELEKLKKKWQEMEEEASKLKEISEAEAEDGESTFRQSFLPPTADGGEPWQVTLNKQRSTLVRCTLGSATTTPHRLLCETAPTVLVFTFFDSPIACFTTIFYPILPANLVLSCRARFIHPLHLSRFSSPTVFSYMLAPVSTPSPQHRSDSNQLFEN